MENPGAFTVNSPLRGPQLTPDAHALRARSGARRGRSASALLTCPRRLFGFAEPADGQGGEQEREPGHDAQLEGYRQDEAEDLHASNDRAEAPTTHVKMPANGVSLTHRFLPARAGVG